MSSCIWDQSRSRGGREFGAGRLPSSPPTRRRCLPAAASSPRFAPRRRPDSNLLPSASRAPIFSGIWMDQDRKAPIPVQRGLGFQVQSQSEQGTDPCHTFCFEIVVHMHVKYVSLSLSALSLASGYGTLQHYFVAVFGFPSISVLLHLTGSRNSSISVLHPDGLHPETLTRTRILFLSLISPSPCPLSSPPRSSTLLHVPAPPPPSLTPSVTNTTPFGVNYSPSLD